MSANEEFENWFTNSFPECTCRDIGGDHSEWCDSVIYIRAKPHIKAAFFANLKTVTEDEAIEGLNAIKTGELTEASK